MTKSSKWTVDEDLYLIQYFNIKTINYMSEHLNRGTSAVYKRCLFLGIKKLNKLSIWTINEQKFLLDNIYYIPLTRISKELNKDIYDIIEELTLLNINMIDILHLNLRRNNWLKHEIEYLKLNYDKVNLDDICKYLNKSKKIVCTMMDYLNLSKNGKKILKSSFNYYELEILKNNYDLSLMELNKLLPNKTMVQIYTKIRKLKLRSRKQTIPEKIVVNILNDLCVEYISEKKMSNSNYIIDFLINNKFAIEVQGDYWHANPKYYNNLNKIQVKMVKRDKLKQQKMLDLNYKILYLWESDLKNDIKYNFINCKQKILKFINN